MRLRRSAIALLIVGGMLAPCVLVTGIMTSTGAPGFVTSTVDGFWVAEFQRALQRQDLPLPAVDIVGESPNRNLVTTFTTDGDEGVQDLLAEAQSTTAWALATSPFQPEGVALTTIWIQPAGRTRFGVTIPLTAMVEWTEGELSEQEYHGQWIIDRNTPAGVLPWEG